MAAVPADLETDAQPPMAVPLRHFLVGLGFLVAGVLSGALGGTGDLPGLGALAHVHLLLVGWVCVTIMGAMTQFVPVWSGVPLHSNRLAVTQLWLVTVGLLGFAGSLLRGELSWLPGFGGLMALGFWLFAYNVGRTLAAARPLDVTERHFALALAYFLALTVLGVALAVDFATPLFARLEVSRTQVVSAHATLAVFGAVLTTVLGALYQLATMFTQTELHGVDTTLRRVEELGYPAGVVALAVGRLLGSAPLARVGGVLLVMALLGFCAILGRRLAETRVDWTPMLSRYAVVVPLLALWSLAAGRAWLAAPLAERTRFGAPGSAHLLGFGVVGFVVFGTLYHVVPFVVWVHRYSDRLGYERVPMIDDLYDARVARADLAALVAGLALLVARDAVSLPVGSLAGLLTAAGVLLFVGNLLRVVSDHGPGGLRGVFSLSPADPEP